MTVGVIGVRYYVQILLTKLVVYLIIFGACLDYCQWVAYSLISVISNDLVIRKFHYVHYVTFPQGLVTCYAALPAFRRSLCIFKIIHIIELTVGVLILENLCDIGISAVEL